MSPTANPRLTAARERVLELFHDRPISAINLQSVADALSTADLSQLREQVASADLGTLNAVLALFGEPEM